MGRQNSLNSEGLALRCKPRIEHSAESYIGCMNYINYTGAGRLMQLV